MVIRKQREKVRDYKFWCMAHQLKAYPKMSDFAQEERELDELKEDEYLVEALYWSVDPYNRTYTDREDFTDGAHMVGFQVGKVIETRARDFPVGTMVAFQGGWRTHTAIQSDELRNMNHRDPIDLFPPRKLSDIPLPLGKDYPLSLSLGVLGLPGVTAFYSLLDVCKARSKDTVVLNCAGGAVGSLAAQIAKIQGCKVIAYTGNDEKVEWLESLGIDHAFNYNSSKIDVDKTLTENAPKGVDVFLDLAGGAFATQVYPHLNKRARVCQVGNISAYNAPERQNIPDFFSQLMEKEVMIKGFDVVSYATRWRNCMQTMCRWIKDGKIQYKETVYNGFEKMPQALIDQMDGKNMGKVIVKKV